MFKVDMDKFTKEQQKLIENIALFNINIDYIMFCGTEDIKNRILPLIANRRLEDVKVSKLIEGIVLIHKDMMKWHFKPEPILNKQRDYDFKGLERKLLGWDKAEEG